MLMIDISQYYVLGTDWELYLNYYIKVLKLFQKYFQNLVFSIFFRLFSFSRTIY